MELFSRNKEMNLLPYDGITSYMGKILTPQQASHYLEKLLGAIEWRNDEAFIFGKHFVTKRKVAWYGDSGFSYTYSNTTKEALPWTKELSELKAIADAACGACFNSCLLNLYHDGNEGMGWHSDDEKSLAWHSPIASISLGAERKFSMKHRQTKFPVSLVLESGSLLVMGGATQEHWVHSLPKSTLVTQPRVNLTFRVMAG